MKPFLQGRNSAVGASLQPSRKCSILPTVAGLARPAPPAAGGGPSIEAVKEGDKVVRLIVTCACGEKLEVECLYSAGR